MISFKQKHIIYFSFISHQMASNNKTAQIKNNRTAKTARTPTRTFSKSVDPLSNATSLIRNFVHKKQFSYWEVLKEYQALSELNSAIHQFQLEEKIKIYYTLKRKQTLFSKWKQQTRKTKFSGFITNQQITANYLQFINSIHVPSILESFQDTILKPSIKYYKTDRVKTESSLSTTPRNSRTQDKISGEKQALPKTMLKNKTKEFTVKKMGEKKIDMKKPEEKKIDEKKVTKGLEKLNGLLVSNMCHSFKEVYNRAELNKQLQEEEENEIHRIRCLMDYERRQERFVERHFQLRLYRIPNAQ